MGKTPFPAINHINEFVSGNFILSRIMIVLFLSWENLHCEASVRREGSSRNSMRGFRFLLPCTNDWAVRTYSNISFPLLSGGGGFFGDAHWPANRSLHLTGALRAASNMLPTWVPLLSGGGGFFGDAHSPANRSLALDWGASCFIRYSAY
jgi:hypothetical protein